MENLKTILKNKKEKSSNQVPKYAMRKLSIGFVSCFLGFMIFMTPTIVKAESVIEEEKTAVVETDNRRHEETASLLNVEQKENLEVAKTSTAEKKKKMQPIYQEQKLKEMLQLKKLKL